jgi:hypothetical protein
MVYITTQLRKHARTSEMWNRLNTSAESLDQEHEDKFLDKKYTLADQQ